MCVDELKRNWYREVVVELVPGISGGELWVTAVWWRIGHVRGWIWVRRARCVDRALSSVGEADLPSICPLWRAPSVLVWAELAFYLPAEMITK